MICKNCKKLIDDDSKFCKNCGKPVEVDEPWNKRICRDEGLWHNEIFQNSPSIIAHEYNRVYELLLENKTYGAMMQIKDLLEVLIKIPVIIEMARLQAKKDKNDKDYEFLLELVRKPLSLGDWRKAIITMNKSNEHFFENEFISDLCKIYMSNIGCQNEFIDVVNWRNQTIGHGALAFDNDEKFKTELKTLLLILSNHFKKWEKVYKDIEIYQKGNEDIVFSGKDYALNLEYNDCELWVRINENIKLSLYPFLLLWDKQFYIFDALIYNKEKYDVLCYPIGQKKHFKKQDRLQKHVKDIYYQCNKVLNRNKILSNSIEYDPSAEDEVILTSLDDFLNASEEKIFEMNMLDKWLANSLQESQDKILLLMMERGMGKTSWIKRISSGKGFGKEILFKTIYLNDTYRSHKDSIISKIDQIMTTDNRHVAQFDDNKNRHIQIDSEDIKKEIADFFSYYIKLYKEKKNVEKIVLVLDGIDEVSLSNNNNIFNCIPTSDMLPDDFYILLTCRNSEDISDFLNICLNELKIPQNNKLTLYRDDENYRKILNRYIEAHIEIADKTKFLKKSEYRFAYLSILVKIFENTDEEIRNKLLDEGNIIKGFIDMVEKNYERKYLNFLYSILYIISTSPEPITVKELSYLLGENKISFKLLGFLNDLKGVLKYERTDNKNKISIANQLYRENIINIVMEKDPDVEKRLDDTILDLVSDIYTEFVEKEKDIVGEGQEFLILHLYHYIKKGNEYINYKFFKSIFLCGERLIKTFSYESTKRGYEILENADKIDFDVSSYTKGKKWIEDYLKKHIHLVLQYKLLFKWQDLYINDDVKERIDYLLSEGNKQHDLLDNIIEEKDEFLDAIAFDTLNMIISTLIEYGKYYYVKGEYETAKNILLTVKSKIDKESFCNPFEYEQLLKLLQGVFHLLGDKENSEKYFQEWLEFSEISRDNQKDSMYEIHYVKLLKELENIEDINNTRKKIYDFIEELENNLISLDGGSIEYYKICNLEAIFIVFASQYMSQALLKDHNYFEVLDFLGRMDEIRKKLITRNYPILSKSTVIIYYYKGIAHLGLGQYKDAIEELKIMQKALEESSNSKWVIKEREDNIIYLRYTSNAVLAKCTAFLKQDFEQSYNYLLKAIDAYDQLVNLINFNENIHLTSILGLYNAIYINAKEEHKEKLEVLRKLFEKYNDNFDMAVREISWKEEYVVIDNKNNRFLGCANGKTPRKFNLINGNYELDFKKKCNSCNYKDCIGYINSGRFRIKRS